MKRKGGAGAQLEPRQANPEDYVLTNCVLHYMLVSEIQRCR